MRPATVGMSLQGALLEDDAAVARWRAAWDALAVTCRRPYCSPAWMLSWWRHAAPPEAELRVVIARDGDDLIGVAPFFLHPKGNLIRYRLLASGLSSGLEPLARPGSERAAAAIFAATISEAQPSPDFLTLEWIASSSPWPNLLKEAWPDRFPPWLHRDRSRPAPTLSVAGRTFDEWLGSKDGKYRRELRRIRRQLENRGATFRLATTKQDAEEALESFASLHYQRWRSRGGSRALNPKVELMLRDVALEFADPLRFRLWSIEVEGNTISTELFVGAGGELSSWQGGFDESWSAQAPSIQAMLAAIAHAFEVGDDRINFGLGGQPYKYRLADGEEPLDWAILVPRGPRYPLVRAGLFPQQAARAIYERLPEAKRKRLKESLGWSPE